MLGGGPGVGGVPWRTEISKGRRGAPPFGLSRLPAWTVSLQWPGPRVPFISHSANVDCAPAACRALNWALGTRGTGGRHHT